MRKFEKISTIRVDIPLPTRSTAKSAGYDISIIHPDVYKLMQDPECKMTLEEMWEQVKDTWRERYYLPNGQTRCLFPTGIKASMEDDEVLMLFIRSSVAVKQGIKLSNNVAIIDADYYNNPDNEGHIMVALDIPLRPVSPGEFIFAKSYNEARFLDFDGPTMRICQGIFLDYEMTDNDTVSAERTGGFGSTGR